VEKARYVTILTSISAIICTDDIGGEKGYYVEALAPATPEIRSGIRLSFADPKAANPEPDQDINLWSLVMLAAQLEPRGSRLPVARIVRSEVNEKGEVSLRIWLWLSCEQFSRMNSGLDTGMYYPSPRKSSTDERPSSRRHLSR
jgi:hypothetical protein